MIRQAVMTHYFNYYFIIIFILLLCYSQFYISVITNTKW